MSLPLAEYLAEFGDRCPHGFAKEQRPFHDCPEVRKLAGINAANDAAADDVKARIDAAIMRVARTGREFSANDFRDMFPESGPIVGGRVNALAIKHKFVDVGSVRSTKPNTHGHKITLWQWRGAR